MSEDMRKRPAGYVPETRGNRTLHRVRVEGDKKRRITIPMGPTEPGFWEAYYAARAGREIDLPPAARPASDRTLRGLVDGYLIWLARQVESGNRSPLTLKQRRSLLRQVCDMPNEAGDLTMGDYDADLPPAAMLHIQDTWGSATSQADNSMKALRDAYKWGIPRDWATHNPAKGIDNVHTGRGGAKPWSADDMRKFLDTHAEGSMPRLWLFLTAFTGARRADLVMLGRGHEVQRAGETWLDWQPGKKGSKPVSLPMAPQLVEATRAPTVVGPTYLMSPSGKPFKNGNVLGNYVQRWTKDAGLEKRSSHGLRKSLAKLLAESGSTENQIMSVLAHSNPKTTAIYTQDAARAAMAAAAMASIRGLRIG